MGATRCAPCYSWGADHARQRPASRAPGKDQSPAPRARPAAAMCVESPLTAWQWSCLLATSLNSPTVPRFHR